MSNLNIPQSSASQRGLNSPTRNLSRNIAQSDVAIRKKRVRATTLAIDNESDTSLEETRPITLKVPKRSSIQQIPKIVITKSPKDNEKIKYNCDDSTGTKTKKKKSSKTPKYYLPRKPASLQKINEPITCPGPVDTTTVAWSDSDDDDTCGANCTCRCPPCPAEHPFKCRHFRPKLYDFLLEDYDAVKSLLIENETKFNDNVMIRCPEYAILLDHAIAVIWYFYRDWTNWNMFNIPQLEWATKFLAGICSQTTRQTFVDVETMRKHLTELLFITYGEVEKCTIETNTPKCPQPPTPPKTDAELPVSLKALFYRAPRFTKHLSTERPKCRRSQKDAMALDKYANARIQQMSEQLEKLRAFEMRYMESLAQDTELQEIIDGIKIHADELVKAREELQHLVQPK